MLTNISQFSKNITSFASVSLFGHIKVDKKVEGSCIPLSKQQFLSWHQLPAYITCMCSEDMKITSALTTFGVKFEKKTSLDLIYLCMSVDKHFKVTRMGMVMRNQVNFRAFGGGLNLSVDCIAIA